MEQSFIFKQDYAGVNTKRNNEPFRFIELHDPKTLENTRFFLDVDSTIKTEQMMLKDKVKANFGFEIRFGKPQIILVQLQKVG